MELADVVLASGGIATPIAFCVELETVADSLADVVVSELGVNGVLSF